ncbi:hypothetical protein HN51_059244, partial [Arachis hypogaea]
MPMVAKEKEKHVGTRGRLRERNWRRCMKRRECAVISKSAGGIGVFVHNICATGSYIRGTNGTSNGINQRGGKRK